MAVQKDLVAGLYDRAAELYDQVGPKTVSRFGKRMIELVGIREGDHVLDVAVGRGANLFPAAERVGTEGYVVGIDIAQEMLNLTRNDLKSLALSQVDLLRMDGEELGFANASFDQLLCGYALFWFGDLQKGLRGFYRMLRPGGTVGISMYGGRDPRWDWYGELIQEYGEKYVSYTRFGGNNVNGNPLMLEAELIDAGFENVQISVEPFEIIYSSADEWWEEKWGHGSRAPLEQMSPDVRSRFKSEAMAKLATMEEGGVYHFEWKTCFATAQKPHQS